MFILMIVFVIGPLLALAIYALTTVAPWLDRHLFDHIWKDPSEEQSRALLKRVRELTSQDRVPEATALMLAAKELHSNEDEVLGVVGALDAVDVARLVSGKKRGPGGWLYGFKKILGR